MYLVFHSSVKDSSCLMVRVSDYSIQKVLGLNLNWILDYFLWFISHSLRRTLRMVWDTTLWQSVGVLKCHHCGKLWDEWASHVFTISYTYKPKLNQKTKRRDISSMTACMQAVFCKTCIYNYIHIHVVNVHAGTIFQESLDLPDEGTGPALCSSPPGKSSQWYVRWSTVIVQGLVKLNPQMVKVQKCLPIATIDVGKSQCTIQLTHACPTITAFP